MSYRDVLDETITEPMPPFETVDELIARERAAQTRRRVAAAALTAFGVVAVLVAVTAFGGTPTAFPPPIGATNGPVTDAPSPTGAPSPSDSSSPWPLPPAEPDPAALRELTTVLKSRMADLLPGSTFTSNHPGMQPLEVTVDRLEGKVPTGSGFHGLWALADIAGGGNGLGSFDLGLGYVDDGQPRAQWCAPTKKLYDGGSCNVMADVSGVLDVLTNCAEQPPDDSRSCKESTGPHGEHIVTETGTVGPGRVEYRVDVTRPDGTALLVMCRNWTRVGDGRAARPPLSVVQLIDIALDPRLAMPR